MVLAHRSATGPFDILGDIHGCIDELRALMELLGYDVLASDGSIRAPAGRTAVFLGDLVDRGPDSMAVLRLAMEMVETGAAICLIGNHDDKLWRKLIGRKVQLKHGLAETLAQLACEPAAMQDRVRRFLGDLPSHRVLDGGRLVVAHAGLKTSLHGRETGRARDFALYGATTGRLDAAGLPIRLDWAMDYAGHARVVYGHTPVAEPRWTNGTINIDTGCVFGGRLTALRYPELELVSVSARAPYATLARPFLPDH
ncbi:MAG: metallophosphoesterase [Chloroflexia bacterium]|nr:metallophosphoesterase [Chloroflexia bacterium]